MIASNGCNNVRFQKFFEIRVNLNFGAQSLPRFGSCSIIWTNRHESLRWAAAPSCSRKMLLCWKMPGFPSFFSMRHPKSFFAVAQMTVATGLYVEI